MNQIHEKDMREAIQGSYAPTGRAKCKKCKTPIEQGSLRLAMILDDDHYFTSKTYYHPDCFTFPPRFKNFDPEKDIENIKNLKPADAKKIKQLIKAQVKRLREGKTPKKEVPASKSKEKEVKNKKQQSKKPAKKQPVKKQQEQEPTTRRSKSQAKKSKSKAKSVSQRSISKSAAKSEKSKSKPAKAQPKKTKKLKKTKSTSTGYTQAQQTEFKELVSKYLQKSADALKAILAANAQSRTGNKKELAQKCADGKILGKIPMCSNCGGGKPRFNSKTGLYYCPGYMDDDEFRNCHKYFTMAEITRDPWVEP